MLGNLIEHPIPDLNEWKAAFDADPIGRRKSGVRRYVISRPIDDPDYVMVDLEFENSTQAEALLSTLRVLWGRVEGRVMTSPKTQPREEARWPAGR